MTTRLALRTGLLLASLALLAGCASVPMAPPEQDAASKRFDPPSPGKAGVYVYRDCFVGKSLKKTVYIDGVAIGETANKVFLHREVDPGQHTVSTESEFSDNAVQFTAVAGQLYFFEQYIKMGLFVGGANLQAVDAAAGKQYVLACSEALGVQATPAVLTTDPPKQ